MAKKIKIISSPKGYNLMDIIGGNTIGDKSMKLVYKKRSKVGKLVGIKKVKKVVIPKKYYVMSVNNHTPKVGKVKITFRSNK